MSPQSCHNLLNRNISPPQSPSRPCLHVSIPTRHHPATRCHHLSYAMCGNPARILSLSGLRSHIPDFPMPISTTPYTSRWRPSPIQPMRRYLLDLSFQKVPPGEIPRTQVPTTPCAPQPPHQYQHPPPHLPTAAAPNPPAKVRQPTACPPRPLELWCRSGVNLVWP